MGWCFKDEATTATDVLLDRLAEETAIVPSLWHLELANVLTLSERKGRITAARISEFIALLDTLSINVDEGTPFRALGAILNVARTEHLTAYDAAYLELAMRLGVPLATKDNELRKAAKRLGVILLGT
jgi:predicted nucleic acid-binding protein